MLDTGSVAAQLWDTWLAPGLQKRFSEHLRLSMADTRALVCWLAATHDMARLPPNSHVNSANKKTVNILVFTANVLSKRSLTFPRDSYLPKKMHNALTASTARAFSLTYSLKML